MVEWDAMPDVGEPASRDKAVLLPTKWNKDCKMAWRLDVDADAYKNNSDSDSEEEINKLDELSDIFSSGSEDDLNKDDLND